MPTYNTFPDFRVSGVPTAIKWPIKKTPILKTALSEAASGKEYRYQNQTSPRWEFSIDFGYLFDDLNVPGASFQNMAQALQGFFIQQGGMYLPFLYQDPWDNTVTNWQFGVGDGSTHAFTLTRGIGSPSLGAVGTEIVQWADPTGRNVYANGTLVNPTTYNTTEPPQQILFITAPASGVVLTWSGTFHFLCRFSQDKFDFVHEQHGWWTTGLKFQTVLA